MKKLLLIFSVALSVSLILLAIAVPVNNSRVLPTWNNGFIQADGVPGPPPYPPPTPKPPSLVADGVPGPPPYPPPTPKPPSLVADGVPGPPPYPPPTPKPPSAVGTWIV